MSFLRSVAILVSGTALGHGITAAALPILSRLYTPADFSLLAVFNGVVSMISVAICLRFDVAVALPEKESDALSLLALSICTAALLTAGIGALVLLAPTWIAAALDQPALEAFLWLIPICALLAGMCSALQMWFVRRKAFPLIAKSRVAQSAAGAGTQIAGSTLLMPSAGLLYGQVVNFGAATLVLGYKLFRDGHLREMLRAAEWSRFKSTFRAYDRFPKYSTWEALCNSVSIQLPIIMIAAFAVPQEAGHLMMAMYVIQAPMALIGGAMGQVFLSKAAEEHRADRLADYTANVLRGLMKAGVGPLLVVGILAPVAFEPIFGTDWERAGVLVAWMTPWFIMQFLASPISMALHVTGHQRAAFLLQLTGLCLRVVSVWLAGHFATQAISETYAISGLVFYALYLFVVLQYVGMRARTVRSLLATSAIPVLAYGIPAALAAFAATQWLGAA